MWVDVRQLYQRAGAAACLDVGDEGAGVPHPPTLFGYYDIPRA
jgi:hypothetical protein